MIEFSGITFEGPPLSDMAALRSLPEDYQSVLLHKNGVVAFHGGFHLRGICETPQWHSLAEVWSGKHALHMLFPAMKKSDIPFGQDCLGDQFLLRDRIVWKLCGESGEAESMNLGLSDFLRCAAANPVGFLHLEPLVQFQLEGGDLKPGELLSAYPPFITVESGKGVSLAALPTLERISFLAHFARQIADVPDGGSIEIRPVD